MAGLSGNPYDWGLDKVSNNMASLSESISRDKALKEQENANNIMNQRNLFAMEKERKQEEMLGKKVHFGTMIRAKGGSEKATQNAIEYARSLGVGDELGNVEFRNMPFLMQTMDSDKQFKISQHDINDADLSEAETGIRDEIKKIEENKYTNPEKFAKDAEILPQKIKMADQLKARRASIQAQKNELLGLKAETNKNVVMTPGSTMATPEGKPVFTAPKETEPKVPTVRTFTEGNSTVEKQWNPETGRWDALSSGPRYKPVGEGGPTPYQNRKTTTDLRKEFNNRPEVKEYNTIMPKIANIDTALNEALTSNNKVAADQALITLFNKMTDPQSVVRESEYARTPENLSFINKMQGKIAKIGTGGAGLTNDDRKSIAGMAKKMGLAYQDIFNKTANEYVDYANGYGLDPKMVIGERRKTEPEKNGGIDQNAITSELARRKGK
jgi:hypothetical protein